MKQLISLATLSNVDENEGKTAGKCKLECSICCRRFQKASQLDVHIRRIHNEEKNNSCTVCSKAFFKKSDLQVHTLIHGNDYKCICRVCGRTFKHISNLNRHLRTHTGVKPYICPVCCKRYSQISALRQHCQTEQHKAKCSEQGKQADLQNSQELDPYDDDASSPVGGESGSAAESSSKRWWFYCSVCGDRFQFMEQLRAHLAQHLHNGDMICKVCQVGFNSISDLMSHGCTKSNAQDQNQTTHQDIKTAEPLISSFPRAESRILNIPCLTGNESLRGIASGAVGTVVISLPTDITTPLSWVQSTQEQNGQLLSLDNNEVLLTLTNNAYRLVLVSGEVTTLENDSIHPDLNTTNEVPIESGDSDPKVTNIPPDNLQPGLSVSADNSFQLCTDSGTVTSDTELTEMLLGALL